MTSSARVGGTPSGDPPRQTRRRAAHALWVAIAVLALVEAAIIIATLEVSVPGQWGFRGNEALLALTWGSIGAIIANREPENRIGWLLLVLSLVIAFQGVLDQYPALAAAFSLPAGEVAAWMSAWIWVVPSAGFLGFVPLIFPDGRLLSKRWRGGVVVGAGAIAVLVATIVSSIRPFGPLAPSPNVTPSLGASWVIALAFGLYLGAAITGVGSIVVRYRQASAEGRQQLKWVAYALAGVVIGAVAGASPFLIGQLFFLATVLMAAIAIGVAILRYRLYEIDVIINRTLVYGALTAILAGLYTASISLSQRLFMAVTGERSDAAVVLTTLMLVATFTPIHKRLQTVVDRRVKPASWVALNAPGSIDEDGLLRSLEDRLRQIAREEVAAANRVEVSETASGSRRLAPAPRLGVAGDRGWA